MATSVRVADREYGANHECKYKFHFMKRGPEPNELCDSLTNKMDSLIAAIDLSESEQKYVNATKKRAISLVKKRVCIRQNISDPTKVDRRRLANQHHTDKGVLRNHNESPQRAAEVSSGRQGVIKFTKRTHSNYKEKQDTLLAYLDCFFGSSKTYDAHSSTEEFCDYIDHYTLSLISLPMDRIENLTSTKLEILSIMLDLCEYVVMGRIVLDWAQPNDFITARGWDNWRKHMYVLISFSAMLTALFMIFITLKGSPAAAIYYGFCVGIFPVLLVLDFTHQRCCISCNLIKQQMGIPCFAYRLTQGMFLYTNSIKN